MKTMASAVLALSALLIHKEVGRCERGGRH